MKKLIISLTLIFAGRAFPFYQPFPIYDLKAGRVTAREPWLLPKDGFETLSNCHLKRGVLEKRRGYSLFGQVVQVDTSTKAPTLETEPVMGVYNHYSGATETLLVMDSNRVNVYVASASLAKAITAFANAAGGNVTVTSAAHGLANDDVITITGTTSYNGTFYVQNKSANDFEITDTWVADDGTGEINEETFIDLTRNKVRFKHASVQNWSPSAGDTIYGASSTATATIQAVIVDTGTFAGSNANGTIVFSNGTLAGTFTTGEEIQEQGTSANKVGQCDGANTDDEFTGDNTNYFWLANWGDITYLTNNNDVIQKYEDVTTGSGSALSRLHIDLDVEAGPDNDVTTSKLIFVYRGRLVLFDITERGTRYYQRARWCEVSDPDTWKDANYLDADTFDVIVTAGFIGTDLYVWFERSIWRFVYTADPDQPYRWERIDSTEGSYAQMSLIAIKDELLSVGRTRIIGFDRRRAYEIDEKIPNLILNSLRDSVAYSFGAVHHEDEQAWISYASTSASANADGNVYHDKILVINYEDFSFSSYDLPIHTLGFSTLESDTLWDDIADVWNDIDWAWDDATLQSGYIVRLMGSQDGKIYRLNDTGADNGSDIEFEAIGGRWNPFFQEGRQARLGWIDFLVDVDANVTFDVLSYINTISSSFQTVTITCSAVEGSEDKVWHRVYVNAVGRFHRIKITNNASANTPRIHAIVPWFEKAGDMF